MAPVRASFRPTTSSSNFWPKNPGIDKDFKSFNEFKPFVVLFVTPGLFPTMLEFFLPLSDS